MKTYTPEELSSAGFTAKYPTGPTSCLGTHKPTYKGTICIPSVGSDLNNIFYKFCFAYVGVTVVICLFYPLVRFLLTMKKKVAPLLVTEDDVEDMMTRSRQGSLKRYNSEAAFNDVDSVNSSVGKGNGSRKGMSSKGSFSSDTKVDVANLENFVIFRGYKDNLLGTACYEVAILFNLFLICIFSVIMADYYRGCQFNSVDNMCFYGNDYIFGNYYQNGVVGFVYWVVSSIWWLGWIGNRRYIRNWYRMPCVLSEAKYVNCWAKDQQEILSTFVSPAVHLLRKVKAFMATYTGSQGAGITVPMLSTPAGQRYYIFRGSRYLVNDDDVMKAHFTVGEDYSDFHSEAKGMSSADAKARLELVGPNEIPFKVHSWFQLVRDEFMTIFYGYQLVMYQVWLWQGYAYVAIPLIFVVLGAGSFQIYMTRRAQQAISSVAEYTCEVQVLRDGEFKTVMSNDVVPGDVVKVQNDWLLPCDLILIQGACVVNESALTGESMPVQKYACNNDATMYNPKGLGQVHTLFAGTTILQAGSSAGEEVRAVVTATSMQTSKGELLSGILYPAQMVFKYEEELPVIVVSLAIFGFLAACLAIYFQIHSGNKATWITRWMYGVFTISQVCSPMIGVTLNVGQLHAVDRLKKKGIFSLNAKRIAISGKIRVFCFDKTGTLTKEGLDFLGVKALDKATGAFSEIIPVTDAAVPANVLAGCATCHALSRFGETFVGNEVEVKMFLGTGWELVERANAPPMVKKGGVELIIVKRFEFDHARQTMSVIVQDKAGDYHVFVKGSFEKIGDLCKPETLPRGYLGAARGAALDGCYVLGLATYKLGQLPQGAALGLMRDEVENSGLDFQGLILFRNELKPDTRQAILDLREGDVRPVMITGDNAHCGHYIAKNCGMLDPDSTVLLSEVVNGQVVWVPIIEEGAHPMSTETVLETYAEGLAAGKVELAIVGRAYKILRKTPIMPKIMWYTRIFARHTPEEKIQVVEMHADTGIAVGMCGDGGNDCGALRAAHAGLALSEAEASVVSPFTAASKSCTSAVELVREGRAALHTSFASFKFVVSYSLDFCILKLSMLWFGCLMSNMCYIMVDCISVVALGYTLVRAKPADKLAKDRPTSSLLGPANLGSLLGTWLINFCFVVGQLFYMKSSPDYVKWPATYALGADFWTLSDNWESTTLYLHTICAFFTTSISYSFGYKFRQPVYKNLPLLAFWAVLWSIHIFFLLAKPNGFGDKWHIASRAFNGIPPVGPIWEAWQKDGGAMSPGMGIGHRLGMFAMILANMFLVLCWQHFGAEGALSEYIRRRFPSPRPKFSC